MKITFLVTTLDSGWGTERAAAAQANMFAKRGHDVSILSVYRESGTPPFQLDGLVSVQYLCTLPLPISERPIKHQAELLGGASTIIPVQWDNQFTAESDIHVVQALRELEADVLICTTPGLTALGSEFAPARVVVIEEEHRDSAGRSEASFEPIRVHGPRIDCIVALTDESREGLARRLGSTAPRLEVIPNFLPDDFRPTADQESRLIVAAGRFVAGKDFAGLIRAFGVARRRAPEWRLRIYGSGPLEDRLRSLVRRSNLDNSVEIFPAVENMAGEWSKAAIFASASRSEGFPLAVLEAMAAGLPVVATLNPGVEELVGNGLNGILVESGNESDLADALGALMTDVRLRTTYSAESLGRARKFTEDHAYSLWGPLIEELASERQGHQTRLERAWRRELTQVNLPQTHHRQASKAGEPVGMASMAHVSPRIRTDSIFALVVGAFDRNDIPYFHVPSAKPNVEVIAVPRSHQEAAAVALEAISETWVAVQVVVGPGNTPVDTWIPSRGPLDVSRNESLEVLRVIAADDRSLRASVAYGCDIEFWDLETPGILIAPRPNRAISSAPVTELGLRQRVEIRGTQAFTLPSLAGRRLWQEPVFPIDVVYTWVDGSDQQWSRRLVESLDDSPGGLHRESASPLRFKNRDELRYSLRALDAFAPWVRHVYIVTAGQRPGWLADVSGLSVVDHSEIFPVADALPTFNSHAIEACLHRIDGLSEHFLYMNDDVFLHAPQFASTFFTASGVARIFPSQEKINAPGVGSPPHLWAAHNNRRLIERDFSISITQSLLHVPLALHRSTGYDIEQRYSRDWLSTVHSRFRSGTDLSVASSLAPFVDYATGKAVPGKMKYLYINVNAADAEGDMRQALRDSTLDVIALGEGEEVAADEEGADKRTRTFLQALLPWPSRFESVAS